MDNKPIPIQVARSLAKKYGYAEIVILAYNPGPETKAVCTYGKSLENAINAENRGNALRMSLGWNIVDHVAKNTQSPKVRNARAKQPILRDSFSK